MKIGVLSSKISQRKKRSLTESTGYRLESQKRITFDSEVDPYRGSAADSEINASMVGGPKILNINQCECPQRQRVPASPGGSVLAGSATRTPDAGNCHRLPAIPVS